MRPRPQDIPHLCEHWMRAMPEQDGLAERLRGVLSVLQELLGASGACLADPGGLGFVAAGDLDAEGCPELADGEDAVERRDGMIVRRSGEKGGRRLTTVVRFPAEGFAEAELVPLVEAAAGALLSLALPQAQGEESFAGFELLARLDQGGMGQIHLARAPQPQGGGLVALKRIWRHLASDRQFVEMFSREVQAVSQVEHPNVVRILEYGVEAGQPYLVMEYLRGASLAKVALAGRAAGRPLGPGAAVALALQWCEGLAAVHARGIVHCDVSPQNLFVTQDGAAKVIDFGLARSAAAGRSADERTRGKMGYVAPEHLLGAAPDARADVFGLGVTLYELLGGSPVPGSLRSYSAGELPPLVPGAVSPALSAAVSRAIRFEPAARIQSARELSQALGEAARADGLALAEPAQLAVLMRDVLGDSDARLQRLVTGPLDARVGPDTKTAALD